MHRDQMSTSAQRVWAEINLSALRQNAQVAAQPGGGKVAVLAVVKANAYGHGLAEVAKAVAGEVQLFGVANLQEAQTARAVVDHPIVILGPALPAEREGIVRGGFVASVSSVEEAQAFSAMAGGGTAQLDCVIDTGMGRMGLAERDAIAAVKKIAELPRVKIQSVSTHLPAADEDAVFTTKQLANFDALIAELHREVPGDYLVHAMPSAGVLGFSSVSCDVVRPGLMLYGVSPLPEFQRLVQPVMTLKARVALLREVPAGSSISYGRTFIAPQAMRVATLSVGYADGLPRSLSNRGAAVLIGGRRCAVLGRVTMDLTM
ncbi:MAG: alanine racemase, partial [Chthoniobacterales bacterium]|nr:alanine racemase [Chthoniobacterales bacterium]